MSEEILENYDPEEQERLEKERQEQLEREERERLEREEQERLERERLERERLEREEQERLERERIEREQAEQERLEQERLEQERIEHENFLKSFPDTTIFYQDLFVSEDASVKFLQGVTDVPLLAEQLGIIENHYDLSELTLKKGIFYLKGYEKPESTIEELKAKKLAEISAEAHKYSQYECEDMYLTSSVGYKINADHKSQDNIRGLIGLGVQCRFKDYNNEYHPGTTIEQLQTMLTECYANGAMLYQQKFNYEDMAANAKSREELYFDVIFEMSDFSKN